MMMGWFACDVRQIIGYDIQGLMVAWDYVDSHIRGLITGKEKAGHCGPASSVIRLVSFTSLLVDT